MFPPEWIFEPTRIFPGALRPYPLTIGPEIAFTVGHVTAGTVYEPSIGGQGESIRREGGHRWLTKSAGWLGTCSVE